jgi:formylglycine-generating enzyme required for sulfatase activity
VLSRWGYEELLAEVEQKAVPFGERKGREWCVERIGPGDDYATFVRLPPNTEGLLVGASPGEVGRAVQEREPHPALVEHPFAIAAFPVTRHQFTKYLEEKNDAERLQDYLRSSPIMPGPEYPTVGVRWNEAVEYCRWLTREAGMGEAEQCYEPAEGSPPSGARWVYRPGRPGYRLPTEDEWEYACRAGSATEYSFGTDPSLLGRYAWYQAPERVGHRANPVGLLRPNPRGLFDMHGNVYEWCNDDFVHPGDNARAIRGGSWALSPSACRAAFRDGQAPASLFSTVGFRVVRTL